MRTCGPLATSPCQSHEKDASELELLLLPHLSPYAVSFPPESFTVIAGNWEVLSKGPEAFWCMASVH